MLDSLARVSRRVGAFTDLLSRERPTATEALLAVQVGHMPLASGARTPGAAAEATTSSQAFGPVARVPTVTPGRDAPVDRASTLEPVVADQTPRAAPTLGWVHRVNFEEGSVYHHTVSRTLNSLFKVLFKFPSLYLFAIGLGVIFSLTRSLPRTLGCTHKQPDSGKRSAKPDNRLTGLSPSMGVGHSQVGLWLVSKPWTRPFQTLHSA